jgi:hypothetical protein
VGAGDWIGIIGLVLAVPLGVATNLLTPRVVSWLEKRKLIKTHKSRQQALRTYNLIRSFHEGKQDKYPHYLMFASVAVMCAQASTMLVILLLLYDLPSFEAKMTTGFVAVICALFGALLMVSIYTTDRAVVNFDAYKKEFENRWGPIESDK